MTRSPLVPPAARPAVVTILTTCLALTAFLGGRYTQQTRAGWLDIAIDRQIQAVAGGELSVMKGLVRVGDPASVLAMAVLLVVVCLVHRRAHAALLTAVAVPGSGAITELILKPLFHRTMGGALSFPSGHATGVCAIAVTIAVLLIDPPRPRPPARVRVLLALGGFGCAGIVVVAVVGAGTHYATDAIGGAALAAAVVLLTALVLDRFIADGGSSRFRGDGSIHSGINS